MIFPPVETSDGMAVDNSVLALVVKSSGGNGVIRVLGERARVMKSDQLSQEVVLTLFPQEKALIIGPLSVRYVRRRKSQ